MRTRHGSTLVVEPHSNAFMDSLHHCSQGAIGTHPRRSAGGATKYQPVRGALATPRRLLADHEQLNGMVAALGWGVAGITGTRPVPSSSGSLYQ